MTIYTGGGGSDVTKRVTHPIGAAGSSTFSAALNFVQRQLVVLPVTTSRWRLRIAAISALTGTEYPGVSALSGAYVGTPTFSGSGRWAGDFESAPTSIQGSAALDPSSGDLVTGWVTDTALQFGPGVPMGVSVGASSSGSVTYSFDSIGLLWNSSGNSSHVGDAVASTLSGGAVAQILDVRVEYEFASTDGPGGHLVTLAVGTSITQGAVGWPGGSGYNSYPHEGWVGQSGMATRTPWVNLGVGFGVCATFADTDLRAFTRADLSTTVPDRAYVDLGTNDVVAGTSAATIYAAIYDVVALLQSLGIPEIYVCTLPPRGLTGSQETARQTVNAALRSMQAGIQGLIDFDVALRTAQGSADAESDLIPVQPHPALPGHARMASLVHVPRR